ncbi:MAG: hypothetical protein QM479_00635 [Pseudomonadota bacterium]
MKPLTLVILLLFSVFYVKLIVASDVNKIENKIIMNMILSLTNKQYPSIYTDSQRIKKILTEQDVHFVESCSSAQIAIIQTNKELKNCNKILIITLKYDLLKTYPDSVASFFWQKGRPNIVFIKSRLNSHNITIGSEFNDFIEESIW